MSAVWLLGHETLSDTLSSLSIQEALSGIFGSVSLATWIFLLVPQLYLNYKTGSAEGISLAFLGVWLIGDITNLSGALWADLVPTVIALAIYFCVADVVLIAQCLYYNHVNASRTARHASVISTTSVTEDEPLLSHRRSSDTIGLPGSHRRRSSALSAGGNSLAKIVEEEAADGGGTWVKNSLSILGVIVVGTAGWAIAWQAGVWVPQPEDGKDAIGPQATALGAKILGYISAVCYLGARIPQIVKNHRDKSCSGLALLFFMLSLMGNLTYGAGILAHSQEKEYLWTNLPWLIGSLGTMVEDAVIFVQFRMYATKSSGVTVE
ncbi:related to membrane protein [Rhynchosporium graminicola]|uniref:Related to membrane protein n=1 Tax=Rhynchosporium graminicola TaxID=2792576 RepID=A0A1E1K001_9HELO|nr:related to membrane protein [Rhynchosporium commune]